MEKEIHYLNRLLRGGWGYCSTGSVHWDASNHTCSDSTISHCIWWRALTSRSAAEGHQDVHCASRLAASSLLLKKTHCGYFVAWLDLKAKQLCPLKPHSKSSYLCFYCFSKVPVFCCTLSDRLRGVGADKVDTGSLGHSSDKQLDWVLKFGTGIDITKPFQLHSKIQHHDVVNILSRNGHSDHLEEYRHTHFSKMFRNMVLDGHDLMLAIFLGRKQLFTGKAKKQTWKPSGWPPYIFRQIPL